MLLVFIINPVAGNGKSHALIERLRHKGKANGMLERVLDEASRAQFCVLHMQATSEKTKIKDIRVYRDTEGKSSQGLCRELAKTNGKELIVAACGGDGTVNDVAQGLVGTEAGMLILPFGSGNDFAKSIYRIEHSHNTDILAALGLDDEQMHKEEQGWPEFSHYFCDAIAFTDERGEERHFVNVMSIGFDSEVALRATKLVRLIPGLGKMSYVLAVLPSLFMKKRYKLHYQLEGCLWEEATLSQSSKLARQSKVERIKGSLDYSLVALANARYYGGGFQPNPFMNLQDGVAELAISKPVGLGKIAKLIGAYRKGTAQKSDVLRMFSARGGELHSADSDKALVITYDGELLYSRSIRFRVKEKALRLCIPRALVYEALGDFE